MAGETVEFGVHDGREGLKRVLIAATPGAKQSTDVTISRWRPES
jgi:hypothetical protein